MATGAPTSRPSRLPSSSPIDGAVLRASGAVVIANVEQHPGSGGSWQLQLSVVRPDAPIVAGTFEFQSVGWTPRWGNGGETGSIRVTTDGYAVVEGGLGTMVIDLLGTRGESPPIRGGAPSVLPDGTVLVTTRAEIEGIRGLAEIARRVTDHGFGEVRDLVVTGRVGASFPRRYVVHGDLSGIEGWVDGTGWNGVTLRWDGTVVKRRPSDLPYLELGTERSAGASGARIVPCDGWGPCKLRWRRRDGTVLSHASVALTPTWTRDGTAVVILDPGRPNESGDSRLLRIQDTGEGLVTTPLGALGPGQVDGGQSLTGMSDWAAVLELDIGPQVTVVPLDGSPLIGPIQGTLALVNP